MYLKLRVLFTLLSALCVAAVVPVGVFFGWVWAVLCALGAFLFYLFMRICKVNQEMQESRPSHADFLNANAPANSDEKHEKE